MFKGLIFVEHLGAEYKYTLIDTHFTCQIITSIIGLTPDEKSAALDVSVALEYKKRNLPIVSNMVSFYLYYNKLGNNISYIRYWMHNANIIMGKRHPELDYEKKYYPCIKRIIEESVK